MIFIGITFDIPGTFRTISLSKITLPPTALLGTPLFHCTTLIPSSIMENLLFLIMLMVCACAAAVDEPSTEAAIRNILPGSNLESGSTKQQQFWFLIGETFMLTALMGCYGEADHHSPCLLPVLVAYTD